MKLEVKELIDLYVANIPNTKTEEGRKESDRLLAEAMALTITPEEKLGHICVKPCAIGTRSVQTLTHVQCSMK